MTRGLEPEIFEQVLRKRNTEHRQRYIMRTKIVARERARNTVMDSRDIGRDGDEEREA